MKALVISAALLFQPTPALAGQHSSDVVREAQRLIVQQRYDEAISKLEPLLDFLTYDTNVDRMAETAFAMSDFKRMLESNVRSRRMILLVDTCHSAGLTGSRGETSRGLSNNLVNLYAERLLYQEEGKAVITSSDVNESSQESPRWGGGHGVFTYFLLEGMRGMADSNVDLVVTVGELFRFVRQRVRLDTDYRQNPRMLLSTNENLALAAVPRSGSH